MRFYADCGARAGDIGMSEGDCLRERDSEHIDSSRTPVVSRRAFIGGSIALGAAMALPRRAWAATATVPLANFYNSIGINAHSWYSNNLWPQRLQDLGILNIRGRVAQNTTLAQKLQTFFAAGGKINTGIVESSNGTLDKTGAQKSLNFLKTNIGLQHVSGSRGPMSSITASRPIGRARYANSLTGFMIPCGRIRSFNPIPLIAPSIWKRILADYQALGDVSQWVDKGCIHYYSGGQRPTTSGTDTMQAALQNVGIIAPSKTIWMTETGWQAPSGAWPISTRAHAKYVLRDYFDAWGYGVEKVFMYQLIDDQQNLFGLCDAAANPKPAYNALKNLVSLVKDTSPGRSSIGYTVNNAPSSLKSFSFSKSDGTFLIVLYLDVSSWDVQHRKDLEYAVSVTVNLTGSAKQIDVYQPTFSATPINSGSGSSVPFFATDHVTVLKVRF